MKICLISNLYHPFERGGAEQVARNISQGLKEMGHEVIVLTTQPWQGWRSLLPQEEIQDGVRIIRFYPLNLFFYLNDYKHNIFCRFFWHIFDVFNWHSFFVVRSILKKEQPQLVLTHNLKGIGYLTPLAIRSLGIKHIHTVHDVQLATPSGLILWGKENSWQHTCFFTKIYQAINCWLFNAVDVIISPSQWLLDFYIQRGFFSKSKKIVLPNPVLPIPSPLVGEGRVRGVTLPPTPSHQGRGGTNTKVLQFFYIGQLEEHKGVMLLLEAFAALNLAGKATLHIVGNGSLADKIKQIAHTTESSIIFHGVAAQAEIPKLLQSADAVIVPSLCYENAPMIISESLAAGIPIIASKIGGIPELVHDEVNGFLFPPGNQPALHQILQICITQPEKLLNFQVQLKTKSPSMAVDKLVALIFNYGII